MAKRKRLTPALMNPVVGTSEIKPVRAPIADVAYDAATVAAFVELSDTINQARTEGRWIERLLLTTIIDDHLVRDRVEVNTEEMNALMESLRQTGQQTAIEVEAREDGTFGLISGWRRVTALRKLALLGGIDTVLAIVRRPNDTAASYVAMVEENEIRASLSFYERGRIVARSTDEGAFKSDKQALAELFHAVPRAKRSKIGSFVRIVRDLDAVLSFPAAFSERSGLALAQALNADGELAKTITQQIKKEKPQTAQDEQALIAKLIRPKANPFTRVSPVMLRNGLSYIAHEDGKVTLLGAALTDAGYLERLLSTIKSLK